MTFSCVVHYKNQTKYSNIKPLSEDNKKRIIAAKEVRERVRGENHHEEQCSKIPKAFNKNHGIHVDPCYKRYIHLNFHNIFVSTIYKSSNKLMASVRLPHCTQPIIIMLQM